MLIDGPLNKAEAQARSVCAIRARRIRTVKAFEDMRHGFRWYAHSTVVDFQRPIVSILRDPHIHIAAGAGELDGIVDEVQHDSFNPSGIAGYLDAGLTMPREVDVFRCSNRFEKRQPLVALSA